jgi:hypothetical protein
MTSSRNVRSVHTRAVIGRVALAAALSASLCGGTARAQVAFHETVVVPSTNPLEGSSSKSGSDLAVAGAFALVCAPERLHGPDGGPNGGVYIFSRDAAGAWTEVGFTKGISPTGFGDSIAFDGTRSLVGGYGLYINGQWQNGVAQFSEYVEGQGWPTRGFFTREGLAACERFGASVALDGSWAVVGAPGDAADGANQSGDVWIFRADVSGLWTLAQTLTPPKHTDVGFGASVALVGDTLLVACEFSLAGAPINGAVYAYRRAANDTWTLEAEFDDVDPAPLSLAYADLALEDGRAYIGAPRQPTGTFLQQRYGCVFVWERDASGTWTHVDTIHPENATTSARFGSRIELDGDRLAISSNGSSTVVPTGDGDGSVDLYERYGTDTWSHVIRFKADPTVFSVKFGIVGLEFAGDQLFIGHASQTPGRILFHDLGSLYHTKRIIDLSTGGAQDLFLRAGPPFAGDIYVMLGSLSGTSPGVDIGVGTLPLVVDSYTTTLLSSGGGELFTPWLGLLDADGHATTQFALPSASSPSFAGLTLHHAFVSFEPMTLAPTHVSNAVAVSLVP